MLVRVVLRLALALLLGAPAGAKPPTGVEKLPEQGLIYHPHRGAVDPKATGLPLEDLSFTASDGVRLNAWWLPAPAGAPTVLYFHGNGGNLSGLSYTFHQFRQAGFGALAVDYRGYGRSEGYPSEQGLYKDARAAYEECLRRGVQPSQLLIHGQSLGGAVAVQLASEKPCAGLILESTFSSARAIAKRLYGQTAAALMVTRYDTQSTVKSVKCPLLVIHGTADDFIPPSMGKAIYRAANRPKWLWLVPEANHNTVRVTAGSEFPERLVEFWRAVAK